jgi:predicted TIM-barrel fold metal-dependent hydrolase
MKVFDVHEHYGFVSYKGTIIGDSSKGDDGDIFEDYLIQKCKKLDMMVAVNGLGIDGKNKIFYDANDRVEKFFKKYPQYIIGMAYVDLDDDKPSVIEKFHQKGFKGFKFIRPKKRYDDSGYMEFYKRCEYYNMVALFHTGIVGATEFWCPKPGAYSDNMNPITLEAIGFECPKLQVIGAHLGTAYYMVACFVALASTYRTSNVYFDISGGDFLGPIYEGRYIGKNIPVSQVLFGLDEPPIRYEEMIERLNNHFDDLGLSQDDKDKIFYKNACRIFGITCD